MRVVAYCSSSKSASDRLLLRCLCTEEVFDEDEIALLHVDGISLPAREIKRPASGSERLLVREWKSGCGRRVRKTSLTTICAGSGMVPAGAHLI